MRKSSGNNFDDCSYSVRKSLKRKNQSSDVDHNYSTNKEGIRKKKSVLPTKTYLDVNQGGHDENFEIHCVDPQTDFVIPTFNGINQISIKGNQYVLKNVPGDGNCFFHCLSIALHGNSSYVEFLRNLICRAVASRWDTLKDMANLCHGKNFLSKEDYLSHMLVDNAWATASEIDAATSVLKTNILTFVQGTRYNELINANEVSYHEIEYTDKDSGGKYISLLLSNGHFQLLLPNEPHRQRTLPPIGSTQNEIDPTSANTLNKIHLPNFETTFEENNASQHRETVYLPEEADVYMKCRKLGVVFQPSNKEESIREKTLRMRRNYRNCKYKENKLNVDLTSLPNAPPLSKNEKFNKAMDSIRSFELEQMSYTFKCCAVCNERRLNMHVSKENICRRCSHDKNPIKMFSSENNMNPAEVPAELVNLSVVEQQLICRIAPSIHVHMLRHGGIASSGHCVTFPQDINEPAQILPKLPQEINIIKVRRQGRNETNKDFRVRRHTVQSALQWLKDNNPAFSDIIISTERLNLLPLNDEIDLHCVNFDHYQSSHDDGPAPEQNNLGNISGESDSGVLLPEPSVNIRDQVEKVIEEVVGPDHGEVTINRKTVTIPWPSRGGVPVSEFTTRNFFTLAFPCLFPTGMGDFYLNRQRTCTSMADWADHLLWYYDGRFAKHPYFKFIVHNMIMRKRT